MTIKLRERVYRLLFSLSACIVVAAGLSLFLSAGAGAFKIPGRATGALPGMAFGVYGLLVLGFIALKSGKTVSVEIFFFASWAFGASLESASVLSLYAVSVGASPLVLVLLTRVALYGRYLSMFSFFTGSLYSCGFASKKLASLHISICLLALLFTTLHPLESGGLDAASLVPIGYAGAVIALEATIAALGVLNYFVAWRQGGERLFLSVSGSAALAAGGMILALSSVSLLVAVPAMACLSTGSIMYLRSLREYYVWR